MLSYASNYELTRVYSTDLLFLMINSSFVIARTSYKPETDSLYKAGMGDQFLSSAGECYPELGLEGLEQGSWVPEAGLVGMERFCLQTRFHILKRHLLKRFCLLVSKKTQSSFWSTCLILLLFYCLIVLNMCMISNYLCCC